MTTMLEGSKLAGDGADSLGPPNLEDTLSELAQIARHLTLTIERLQQTSFQCSSVPCTGPPILQQELALGPTKWS